MAMAASVSLILFVLLTLATVHAKQESRLARRIVDPDAVSISGFSSGGAMAMQFHFVNSDKVVGTGIFAGSPYLCGSNFILCVVNPVGINVTALVQRAIALSDAGEIANVQNITGSKVFLYHGQLDSTNSPINGEKVKEMYSYFEPDALINLELEAEHSMPTSFYGAECGVNASPEYISNCSYEAAFEMLNHLYGGDLIRPESYGLETYPGLLLEFDQQNYTEGLGAAGLGDIGVVYYPTGCAETETQVCKLHMVFHGCNMNRNQIGDTFILKTGYLEVAEANNIIMIFPQTRASLLNPGGCWDTAGYTGANYATRDGAQNVALNRMIDSILGR